MSYIPEVKIEEIAQEVFRRSGRKIPVDIDGIIEFQFDLNFDWQDLPDNILAALNVSERTIYMNSRRESEFQNNIGRMNFTKAHELGHWILHATESLNLFEKFSENLICRGIFRREPIEWQADYFAASLLMPREKFTEYYLTIPESVRYSWDALNCISTQFLVSKQAARIRLEQLKLIYVRSDGKILKEKPSNFKQTSLF